MSRTLYDNFTFELEGRTGLMIASQACQGCSGHRTPNDSFDTKASSCSPDRDSCPRGHLQQARWPRRNRGLRAAGCAPEMAGVRTPSPMMAPTAMTTMTRSTRWVQRLPISRSRQVRGRGASLPGVPAATLHHSDCAGSVIDSLPQLAVTMTCQVKDRSFSLVAIPVAPKH